VALSRRTGERPELYLGLGILGTAVFGYGAQIASLVLRGGPSGGTEVTVTMVALTFFGKLLHDAGVTSVLLFVLTVFRRNETGPRILFGLAVASLWIGMVGLGSTGGYRDLLHQNAFWWMEYGVIWTYPLWGACESFLYYRRMRKRARLGLADPLVANRFLLWGLASVGTLTAVWLTSWPMLLADPAAAARYGTFDFLATAAVGIATVTVYSLAFLPPAWYRRWLADEQPAGEPEAA